MGKTLMKTQDSNFIAILDLENVGVETNIAFLTCIQTDKMVLSSSSTMASMAQRVKDEEEESNDGTW
jgi:hypothetical protein